MLPNLTNKIVPKWNWHNCTEVTLPQLSPSDTSTIVPKWDWHGCLQVRMARLFPINIGATVSKWNCHEFSQVTLAWLFPNDTSTVAPKWDWHDYSQDCCHWFQICVVPMLYLLKEVRNVHKIYFLIIFCWLLCCNVS